MAMVILLQQQKSWFIGVNFIHFSCLFFRSFGGVKSDISHFFLLKFLAPVRLTDGRSVVQCSPASFLSDSESEVGGKSKGGLEGFVESHVILAYWRTTHDLVKDIHGETDKSYGTIL